MFEAIRAGRVSVVTDQIERFTEHGLALKSGAELPADLNTERRVGPALDDEGRDALRQLRELADQAPAAVRAKILRHIYGGALTIKRLQDGAAEVRAVLDEIAATRQPVQEALPGVE